MGGGEGAGGVAGATRRACVTPHRLGSIRAHHFRCPVAGTGPVDPSRPLAATHPRAPFDRAYGTAKQAPRTSCPGAGGGSEGGLAWLRQALRFLAKKSVQRFQASVAAAALYEGR